MIDAIVAANSGTSPSYATDALTVAAEHALSDFFETEVRDTFIHFSAFAKPATRDFSRNTQEELHEI